jgi:hypothetical protein
VKGFWRRQKDVKGDAIRRFQIIKNWGKWKKIDKAPLEDQKADGSDCKRVHSLCSHATYFLSFFFKRNEQKIVTSSKFLAGEAGFQGVPAQTLCDIARNLTASHHAADNC